MASGPITSWQIEGENVGAVKDLIFLGSKITGNDDCSHEIKRRLLLGRKAMTNIASILKSRDITLLTKLHIVKAMVFPGVTYTCESWITNKVKTKNLKCVHFNDVSKNTYIYKVQIRTSLSYKQGGYRF